MTTWEMIAEAATSIAELDAIYVARCAEVGMVVHPVPPSITDRDRHVGMHKGPDGTTTRKWTRRNRLGTSPGTFVHETLYSYRLARSLRVRYGRDYPRLRGRLLPEFARS